MRRVHRAHPLVWTRPYPRPDRPDPRRRTGQHHLRSGHRNPARPPVVARDLRGARGALGCHHRPGACPRPECALAGCRPRAHAATQRKRPRHSHERGVRPTHRVRGTHVLRTVRRHHPSRSNAHQRGLSMSLAAWALGLSGAGQLLGRLGYAPLSRRTTPDSGRSSSSPPPRRRSPPLDSCPARPQLSSQPASSSASLAARSPFCSQPRSATAGASPDSARSTASSTPPRPWPWPLPPWPAASSPSAWAVTRPCSSCSPPPAAPPWRQSAHRRSRLPGLGRRAASAPAAKVASLLAEQQLKM